MIGVKTDSEEDGWWLNRIADTTIVALQCTYCSVMKMLLNTGKQLLCTIVSLLKHNLGGNLQSATVFQMCPDTTMHCRNMQWNVQSATVHIWKYANLQICKNALQLCTAEMWNDLYKKYAV